jgi:hypothetical protein
MCKCHFYNPITGKFERRLGEASLNSVCEGEIFHFPYERTLRTRKTFGDIDSYCPPIEPEIGAINQSHRYLNTARVNVVSGRGGPGPSSNLIPSGTATVFFDRYDYAIGYGYTKANGDIERVGSACDPINGRTATFHGSTTKEIESKMSVHNGKVARRYRR